MNKPTCIESKSSESYVARIKFKMTAKQDCLYLSVFLLLFPLNLGFGADVKKVESPLQDSSQINQNLSIKISSVPSPPPGRPGRPRGGTGGGGTRGGCPQDVNLNFQPDITLLIPNNKQGLTVEKYPTFFVFVPPTKSKTGEFVLYDRTEKQLVYQTTFELSGIPGIISIQLPKDKPPLKIGNNYEWRFLLHCKPNDDRSEDIIKSGEIKRVAPNEAIAKIQGNPNSLEKARVYQQNNLWYDALQTVAELRPKTGMNSNAATMWQELLQAENLKEIISYPLIDCCKPAK